MNRLIFAPSPLLAETFPRHSVITAFLAILIFFIKLPDFAKRSNWYHYSRYLFEQSWILKEIITVLAANNKQIYLQDDNVT